MLSQAEQEALQAQVGRVQRLMLDHIEEILTPDEKGKRHLTSMDLATISRLLKENNFRVDANDKVKDLKQIVADIHARKRDLAPRILPDPTYVGP